MSRYAVGTEVPVDIGVLVRGTAFLSWIAGVFEGEGTITITMAGKKGYTRPAVMLTSTDESMVAPFQKRWPGCIRRFTPPGNSKPAVTWALSSRPSISRFLFDMHPFFKTERVRRKSELVQVDIAARVQGARGLGKEYLEACYARREEMAVLNKRGVL
jgi:hypothetical protein